MVCGPERTGSGKARRARATVARSRPDGPSAVEDLIARTRRPPYTRTTAAAIHPGARRTKSAESATTGTCVPRRPPIGSCSRGATSRRWPSVVSWRSATRTTARGVAVAESAHPPGRARQEQGEEGGEQERAAVTGTEKEVDRGGRHDARGHEVRPDRDAGQETPEREPPRWRLPARQLFPAPEREHQQQAAEDERRRVERRREGGEQEEVRGRAGQEERGGKGGGGMQRAAQRPCDRDEGEAEQEDGKPQRFRRRAQRRHERHRHPRVQRRSVGLAPHRRSLPGMAGHEADDRGVAVDRRAQRLDPEGNAHHEPDQDGQGKAPLHGTAASSAASLVSPWSIQGSVNQDEERRGDRKGEHERACRARARGAVA